MSVRHALLAILDQSACYGYQLRAEFTRRTGTPTPLNVGQVYNTLDRLERDALVRRAEADNDGQIYYECTEAGSAEAARWMTTPVPRGSGSREELAMKIALALTLPGIDMSAVLAAQRESTEASLRAGMAEQSAAGAPTTGEGLARIVVLDSTVSALEAERLWLESVSRRLSAADAGSSGVSFGINTIAPKRGRPTKPLPP